MRGNIWVDNREVRGWSDNWVIFIEENCYCFSKLRWNMYVD